MSDERPIAPAGASTYALGAVARRVVIDYLRVLAARHLKEHMASETVESREWHRGMWEAYKHAAGLLERGEVPDESPGEHLT